MSILAYEAAMRSFCAIYVPGQTKYEDTKDSIVPVVHATPDRAFAEYANHLIEKKVNKAPLPLVSIQKNDPTFDQQRALSAPRKRIATRVLERYRTDDAYIMATRPQPWDFPFQIEIWSANQREIDYLLGSFLMKFDNEKAPLWVPHVSVISEYTGDNYEQSKSIHTVFLESVGDNSDLEPPPDSGVEFRKTIDVIVKGWLIGEPITVPLVNTVAIDIKDFDSGEVLLESILSGYEKAS